MADKILRGDVLSQIDSEDREFWQDEPRPEDARSRQRAESRADHSTATRTPRRAMSCPLDASTVTRYSPDARRSSGRSTR